MWLPLVPALLDLVSVDATRLLVPILLASLSGSKWILTICPLVFALVAAGRLGTPAAVAVIMTATVLVSQPAGPITVLTIAVGTVMGGSMILVAVSMGLLMLATSIMLAAIILSMMAASIVDPATGAALYVASIVTIASSLLLAMGNDRVSTTLATCMVLLWKTLLLLALTISSSTNLTLGYPLLSTVALMAGAYVYGSSDHRTAILVGVGVAGLPTLCVLTSLEAAILTYLILYSSTMYEGFWRLVGHLSVTDQSVRTLVLLTWAGLPTHTIGLAKLLICALLISLTGLSATLIYLLAWFALMFRLLLPAILDSAPFPVWIHTSKSF